MAADLITQAYLASVQGQSAPDPLTPGGMTVIAEYAPLISAASASFVSMCNRATIAAATITETRSGDGSDRIILRNSPVISITSVSINGLSQAAYSQTSPNGYVLLDDGWTLKFYGASFPSGDRSCIVTYVAGYNPIPADIQEAIAEWVIWKAAKMKRIDQISISMNGTETTTFDHSSMPPLVKDTIAQYKVLGGFRGAA